MFPAVPRITPQQLVGAHPILLERSGPERPDELLIFLDHDLVHRLGLFRFESLVLGVGPLIADLPPPQREGHAEHGDECGDDPEECPEITQASLRW